MSVDDWTTFDELLTLVTTAYQDYGNKVTKSLELKLSRLRPRFKNLLEEEGKCDEKIMDFQTGRFVLNGRTEHSNADFVKQAIQLSDLLNINELKAASLLKHAMSCPDYDREPMDVAILEYNRERLSLLHCLEMMIKGANDLAVPDHSRAVFSYHVKEIFAVDGGVSVPRRMLDLLSSLGSSISALREDAVVPGMMTGSTLKTLGITEQLILSQVQRTASVRWSLGCVYFHAMMSRITRKADVLDLVEMHRDIDLGDGVWYLLLLSLLSALEPPQGIDSPLVPGKETEHFEFLRRVGTIVYGLNVRWNVRALQEIVGVQFCVHVKQIRLHYQQIEQELGLPEGLDSRLEHGLHSFPFAFVAERVISRNAFVEMNMGMGEGDVDVDTDIFDYGVGIIQGLVENFLKRLGRVVRSLKNKAEDAEAAMARGGQLMNYLGEPATTPFESLLSLVAALYRDRPESGIRFWKDPELFKFIRFMADVRSDDLLRAFLEVLASLSTGRQCAQCATGFLSTEHSKLSWEALFRSLDLTAKTLAAHPEGEMNPAEIALQKAFLRLLRQVVRFSSVARTSLHAYPHLQAINTLFSLLLRRVSVDLKAALFEAVAAFCIPTERNATSDIAHFVWRHLEIAEIVPRPQNLVGFQYGGSSTGGQQRQVTRGDGIRYDMDQVESQSQTYPETIAFLQLISVLMMSSRPVWGAGDVGAFGGSGMPSATTHYIDFVVEDVFLKINNRLFVSVDERWRMIELCLQIFDVCIRNFDASFKEAMLVGGEGDGETLTDSATLSSVSMHPAFTIMSRILSGSPLIRRIFDVVANGVEAVNTHGRRYPSFANSIRLSLRIILRMLQAQGYFMDMIASDRAHALKISVAMTGLDQLLAFYKDVIVHIALFVNCQIDDEICLLAVNVLTLLSDSPTFNSVEASGPYGKMNRLVNLLSFSSESNQIVAGFVHRLQLEEAEGLDDSRRASDDPNGMDMDDITADADLASILYDNAPSEIRERAPGFANLIRLAILELLIANVQDARPFPTVAHYLLGYNLAKGPGEVEIVGPATPGGRVACLYVILELMRTGEAGGEDEVREPLYELHPKLAEKCYQLLYKICASHTTSSTTMRYLRTSEDFFYRQLQSFPVDRVEGLGASKDAAGIVESQVRKVSSSKLHQRGWLLKLIALELHITTLAGQRSQAQRLLDLLYISPVSSGETMDSKTAGWGFSALQKSVFNTQASQQGFEQPLTKMLEVFNSIDLARGGEYPTVLKVSDVDLNRCQRIDEYGRPVYDIRAAHSLLVARQRAVEKQGAVAILPDRARMRAETTAVLHELLKINFHIESLGARIHCVDGWCRIVRVTLARSFEMFPPEMREEKIYELLANVFPRINAPDTASDFVEALSHVILALLWRLREDRVRQAVIQSALGVSDPSRQGVRLPAESLQQVVLKGILDGILKSGSSSALRANHYAALTHFFHYTNPDELEAPERPVETVTDSGDGRLMQKLSAFAAAPKEAAGGGFASYRTQLLLGNLTVIASYGDRFLEMVCKDASDGNIYLKTIAFAVIEALCCLSAHERPNRVIAFMARRNFLGDFVRVFGQREDAGIQALLRNESSSDFTSMFLIYQIKMSMLLRVAQQREGYEKLLETGILEVLTECHFIEHRPEVDGVDSQDMDTQSPHAQENYHQAITPILRLLCIFAQNGRENIVVIGKIALFIQKHQDALMAILREKWVESAKGSEKIAQMRDQKQLIVALLSCLAGCRNMLEFEGSGPGNRSFHNVLMSLSRQYMIGLDLQGEDDSARHILHVCRSILSYCDLVTSGINGPDESLGLIFQLGKDMKMDGDSNRISPGVLAKLLGLSIMQFFACADEQKSLRLKVGELRLLPVDEINAIVRSSKEPLSNESTSSQRQQWAGRELRRRLKSRNDEVMSLLYIIEHALLLLWRYFHHVQEMQGRKSADTSQSEKLTADVRMSLTKLATVQLSADMVVNHEARNAFIQMLVRKLKEML
ncbi:hypothetical protein HDU67_006294 [Dinochytrium kinnereticum]|nr:hypothetical protein HDU67_006294 [Dinochytrium kinnereticum]